MCLFAVKMTPAVVICPKRKSYLTFLSNLFSVHIWICNDIKSFGLNTKLVVGSWDDKQAAKTCCCDGWQSSAMVLMSSWTVNNKSCGPVIMTHLSVQRGPASAFQTIYIVIWKMIWFSDPISSLGECVEVTMMLHTSKAAHSTTQIATTPLVGFITVLLLMSRLSF